MTTPLRITAPGASPQEVAAIAAAIEQFNRDTAPPVAESVEPRPSAWKRAALLEGISRQPEPPSAR